MAALQAGQVDAIVVDLPTAFYLAGAVLDDGKVVGQLPDSSAGGDELAFVLPKGSALTGPSPTRSTPCAPTARSTSCSRSGSGAPTPLPS